MAQSNSVRLNKALAGEMSVCVELLKRGHEAHIVMGNAKATDIIICRPDRTFLRVEVKTTVTTQFVTGFFQKYYLGANKLQPDIWIFVRLNNDGTQSFYILTHNEVAVEQMKRNNLSAWPTQRLNGVDNLLEKQLLVYKDQWSKI